MSAGSEVAGTPLHWTDSVGRSQRSTVPVPVDHRSPGGATIDLAVVRYEATDPECRAGVLVALPDDPGSSGISLAGRLADELSPSIRSTYDVVGFDHRFSGESAPLSWGLDQREIFWVFHQPESFSSEVRFQAEIAAKAAAHSLDILPHVTTRNISRDLDLLRRALGEDKICLLGHNYGSYVAAVYCEMFGRHADKVILDSVLSPDWVWRGLFVNFAQNCEDALTRWCAATAEPGERLGETQEAVRDAFDGVLRTAAAKGLMLGGVPIPLDDQFFRVLTMLLLSSGRTYTALADVVRCAGSGASLDPSTQRLLGSLFAVPRDSSTAAAQLAILCGDAAWPRAFDEYEKALTEAPGFMGEALLGVKAGAFWPVPPAEPPTEFGATSAGGVLLVQAERDMFTAAVGAERLRGVLGERARLVMVRNLVEHRVFPFAGQPRVNAVAEEFLATGRLPAADVLVDAEALYG
jgi:pimeloyl-ACP methyl ester carboxylesterase